MDSTEKNINDDLIKERAQCSFDVSELTYFLDGGKENTEQRRKLEKVILSCKELKDPVPEEYLSHKEKYENAIRKSCLVYKLIRENAQDIISKMSGNLRVNGPIARIVQAVIMDVSSFFFHVALFISTIIGQGDREQQAYWLPRALDMNIIGAFAQTELGHGSNVRALETTATYDPETKEFILNSPTLTSYKWWPGGLAHTASHTIVIAQLYTKERCHGVHSFFVQIRDGETHMPCMGIKVGEIGPKMGLNTAGHGFLGFQNYRVPREAMLMKNQKVLEDGTYVKLADEKLKYGTMVYARVSLVSEGALHLARAVTIAIRYSAVRRQSRLKPDAAELQILDYITQQHKLFICIATTYALDTAGNWLWNTYQKISSDIRHGKTESLPELHALTCCLKAIGTADAAACVEECRLACGGHGFLSSSRLPLLYGLVAAACIYEGDKTVLLLQTARFLVKAWNQVMRGIPVTQTVSYLQHADNNRYKKWDNTIESIIAGFQAVAAGKISSSVKSLYKRTEMGLSYEEAWNLTSMQLVMAAEGHCRAVLMDTYWAETQRSTTSLPDNVRIVLQTLAEVYIVYWALERVGDLLQFTSISENDIVQLQAHYELLLRRLRPDAVAIVDAFDFRDEMLNSALGAYDGRVYERLMAEALKSPLNAEPVNRTFHTHLKPMMQGKL